MAGRVSITVAVLMIAGCGARTDLPIDGIAIELSPLEARRACMPAGSFDPLRFALLATFTTGAEPVEEVGLAAATFIWEGNVAWTSQLEPIGFRRIDPYESSMLEYRNIPMTTESEFGICRRCVSSATVDVEVELTIDGRVVTAELTLEVECDS
ncbi:MAG: hypothetical protein AAGF12_41585 [Myxococcota bacterium]